MSFDEFFNYIFNKDFMKQGIVAINNNQQYKQIYQIIEKEPRLAYQAIINEGGGYVFECFENIKRIMSLQREDDFPDIMNYINGIHQKFNTIIYYNENANEFKNSVYKDSIIFERNTPGAFILVFNLDSFRLIREEILRQNKRDKRTIFNLITTGSQCDKVMKFIKENKEFENCIKHILFIVWILKNGQN